MLPRPHSSRIPDGHRLAGRGCAHHVRYEAVLAEVAAADHVAGTRGCHAWPLGRGEERAAVGEGHELGAGLAARVGVLAPERLVLAVAPLPAAVQVALVARHHHHRADRRHLPHAVEHVHRAHHVDRVGGARLLVRPADDWLRGEVQHHLGVCLADGRHDRLPIAHVALDRADPLAHRRKLVQRRPRAERPREAHYLRPHRPKPQRQPRALEAVVPGDEHAPARPEARIYSHSFHGGSPESHSSSR